MDSFLGQVFAALPNAASSPAALVAYLAALLVGGFVVYRLRRYSIAGKQIEHLPEADRLEALIRILGEVPVGQLSPTDYIKLQTTKYIFYAFLVLCATFVVVSAMAVKEVLDREALTNSLIEKTLDPPSSQFQSSFNVIDSAPNIVATIAQTRDPNPTYAQQEALIERLVEEGYRQDEMFAVLAQLGYGGELQEVNQRLIISLSKVDSDFLELRECFEQQRCTAGASKMPVLCEYVNAVVAAVKKSNENARSVPRVLYNQSGTDPLFGSGITDAYWDEAVARNTQLLSEYCV